MPCIYDDNGICFECDKLKPATSSSRVKQYRIRQKELGRLKREIYLTDLEYSILKIKLLELRDVVQN